MTRKLWLGTLVMALAFGITFAGCAREDRALNGSWSDGESEFRFRNGNWEALEDGSPAMRGTYTARDGEIVMTLTHVYDDGVWLDRDMMREFYLDMTGMDAMFDMWMADMLEPMLDEMFGPQVGTYYISDDTLTLTIEGEVSTLTRG